MRAWLFPFAAAALVAACNPPASPTECEKMADHVYEIELSGMEPTQAAMSKPVLAALKKDIVESCLHHGRHKEVTCALKAKTSEELDRCQP